MALTKCNVSGDVIGSLATRAEERLLSTQAFKDKFDEMPEGIKQYINEVLTEEIDAHIADYLAHKAEHLRIEKGVSPPENPNSKTFWLENLGESIDFVFGDGLLIGNASTDGSDDVWFDENI